MITRKEAKEQLGPSYYTLVDRIFDQQDQLTSAKLCGTCSYLVIPQRGFKTCSRGVQESSSGEVTFNFGCVNHEVRK